MKNSYSIVLYSLEDYIKERILINVSLQVIPYVANALEQFGNNIMKGVSKHTICFDIDTKFSLFSSKPYLVYVYRNCLLVTTCMFATRFGG